MTSNYKQPHEGIVGMDRTGDPLVTLDDELLPVRAALITVSGHLQTATQVGNPAPVVQRMNERLRSPQVGDLVVEQGKAAFMRAADWYRGFGYLVERRREWWVTDEEWEAEKREDETLSDANRSVDEAWYIQYGSDAGDVCRWTDCSFRVIPIGDETFAAPAGERTGTGVTFTRDSLLSSLADSGFQLRLPQ
jgi:hypothetical protein